MKGAKSAMLALAAGSLLLAPMVSADPTTRLEDLIDQLRAMPGFSARFQEEKQISLLTEPLRSSGSVYFLPPDRLLRRVDEPHASLLRLEGEKLVFADATGSESFDLGANKVARVFAHTFTDILAGDLEQLRATYTMSFSPERGEAGPEARPWRLDLEPRDPVLARAITGISLRGHGLLLIDLMVREGNGDSTLTRFADVDPDRRFQPAEIAALLRPPTP